MELPNREPDKIGKVEETSTRLKPYEMGEKAGSCASSVVIAFILMMALFYLRSKYGFEVSMIVGVGAIVYMLSD